MRSRLICGMSRKRVRSLQSSSKTSLSTGFALIVQSPVIGVKSRDRPVEGGIIDAVTGNRSEKP
jgi:hypothetical protein